jgi:hypothetical protein
MKNGSVKNFTRGVGGIVMFSFRDLFLASFMSRRVIFASFDHSKEVIEAFVQSRSLHI